MLLTKERPVEASLAVCSGAVRRAYARRLKAAIDFEAFMARLKPRPFHSEFKLSHLLRGLSFTPYPAYIRKLRTVV
jgi:hypothetical protein